MDTRVVADLYQKLHHALRCKMVWVMDLNWYHITRQEVDSIPHGYDFLLGYPIVVREDGGEPHIEWLTPGQIKFFHDAYPEMVKHA